MFCGLISRWINLGVAASTGGGDLIDDVDRPCQVPAALLDQIEQRLALHQAHVDVQTAVDLAPVAIGMT
jgi:hypothetical protein